jgi:hypothetical protein
MNCGYGKQRHLTSNAKFRVAKVVDDATANVYMPRREIHDRHTLKSKKNNVEEFGAQDVLRYLDCRRGHIRAAVKASACVVAAKVPWVVAPTSWKSSSVCPSSTS